MSGHSKWSQIKRTKGVLDKKRGVLFSRLAKQITIAARDGANPDMNFRLRLMILKAREQGMPNDNIDRAIQKASGAEGGALQPLLYEGYGPAGTAFLIEAASDNPNRTYQNLRTIFTKNDGAIGTQGSVAWQFQNKGQILVERIPDSRHMEAIELAAIEAGANDVRESEEGLEIYTASEDLERVKDALATAGARIAQAELIMESSQGVDLSEEQKPAVQKLFDALSDDEDSIAVHTSANL